MNVLFVNPKGESGWLPSRTDAESFEQLLEEETQSKAIFLPNGCHAEIMAINGEYYIIIYQDPHSSTISDEQQKEIVNKIDNKLGGKAIFLPPGCTIDCFELDKSK